MSAVQEGTIPFHHEGETFETYYRVFGDLANTQFPPLIGLHGGPGLCLEGVLPLADLADAGIPVILYDQLGNGRSTHLKEKPMEFWNIDLFISELENVIKHFGIQEGFSLAGHSWGGILALELEVRRQPLGLKKLVISDSLPSVGLWMQSNMQLAQHFPKEVQDGLMGGMGDLKAYRAALREFHKVHGCILDPPPYEVTYSLDQVFGENGDPTVAKAPILKGWTIIDRLDRVRVPTFVINGRADIAQDFVVAPFFEKIRKVKWVTFENSSHTPMFEERERYIQLVGEFLKLNT